MAVNVPTVDSTKSQATSNFKPAGAGAIGILAGSAVLGSTVGPAVGGVLSGAAVGGSQGDSITITSVMLAANNAANSASASTSTRSAGVR